MKRTYLLFLFAAVIHCLLSADIKVLSIGIGNYPENSGWQKINSHNDVELIKSNFPGAITIEDCRATYTNISRQLHLLVANANAGDTVIVHFSGHGQQIVTKFSGIEADGVDEALVPYDAAKRKSKAYDGSNHYTDDEFGEDITALRKKVGKAGLVIAVIDACHSDSMDKDADDCKEIYRGTNEIFGAESLPQESIEELKKKYHLHDNSPIENSDDMSNVIFISACRSDQRNYEIVKDGTGYGSLTYFFNLAVSEKGLKDIPDLLTDIYRGMSSEKSLKFHGQLPAVRTTIAWNEPEIKPVIINSLQESSKSNCDFTLLSTIISILLLIIIAAIIAIWKKNRR